MLRPPACKSVHALGWFRAAEASPRRLHFPSPIASAPFARHPCTSIAIACSVLASNCTSWGTRASRRRAPTQIPSSSGKESRRSRNTALGSSSNSRQWPPARSPVCLLLPGTDVLPRRSASLSSTSAGLISHPDPFFGAYGLDHKLLEPISRRIGIPWHPGESPLHAIGRLSPTTSATCQLILRAACASLPRRYFPACSRDSALLKQIGKSCVKGFQFFLPLFQFLSRHILSPLRFLSSSESTNGD